MKCIQRYKWKRCVCVLLLRVFSITSIYSLLLLLSDGLKGMSKTKVSLFMYACEQESSE
jgi:hypothetical protein